MTTDNHEADPAVAGADEGPATEAPISSPPSGPPVSPPRSGPPPLPSSSSSSGRSSSMPLAPFATAAAAVSNRFGSGAPLAPPRPGPSSGPPRSSFSTLPPPPMRFAAPVPTTASVSETASSTVSDRLATDLREQLEALQRTLAAKQTELRTILVQRDARIAEVVALQRELESVNLAHAGRVQQLEQALVEARAQHAPADDLQCIRGIGPAFARELARLGVRTYEQIAAWSDADVQAIAPQIKARVERIRRDDWRKSAAELVAERKAH